MKKQIAVLAWVEKLLKEKKLQFLGWYKIFTTRNKIYPVRLESAKIIVVRSLKNVDLL